MKLLSSIWVPIILAFAIVIGIVLFRGFGAAVTPPVLPETSHDGDIDGKAVAALWNTQTGYIEQLSTELQQGLSEIKQKKEELKLEENRLKNEKEELKRLQVEIENNRKKLTETITTIESTEVKNIRSQATVYSNMDPASTVKVFETMDDVEVVKILYFMGSDVQSEIFQAMIAAAPAVQVPGLSGNKITGAAKVARFNEMLKFTVPPKK
jgi:flagellar motility protein MotE (MotC chaperone)